RLATTRFDENYSPSASSRATTNFANLARGDDRRQNLQNAITMINRRFNDLADWDNPTGDRYALDVDIVSAELEYHAAGQPHVFPLLEMLEIHIRDLVTGARHPGILGNSLSSYIRDYDFSVRLPAAAAAVPADFGDLHGKLFQHFVESEAYRARTPLPPVICISGSSSKPYRRTTNTHPVLGVEYAQPEPSLTDAYFAKMGLRVRYFMPRG